VRIWKVEAIFDSSGTSGLSSKYCPFMEYLIIFEKGGRGRKDWGNLPSSRLSIGLRSELGRQSPKTSLLE
jgi:hypothetical protein